MITFGVSVAFNLVSNGLLAWLDLYTGFILLLLIIFLGILFDVVGVATTAAQEEPFHAMAAHRVPGAREAGWLVRHQDQVANFTLDIVGDIVGTLSGAIGATIVFRIASNHPGWNEALLSTLVVALVAALSVGGKAYGKVFAFERRTEIVLAAGKVLHFISRVTGLQFNNSRRRRRSGKKRGNSA